ncbi:M20 family peptidase [Clostridium sp. ZS2-4]|uniref:M20 family peptidase n=1 Tax=Clostridium sp. ZS2-4 TaxID=2987703 RepID=UPI00227D5429|nr:M20 family peptidase [Clostridium sp. ZS2-4]MCY6354797.1 M20 family peptidase [Clostridium sp. ZS2-4]
MKQEIITYLSTIKEDINNITKYLYEHPEESFCEHKSYNYIISLLNNKGFKVTENFLEIPTSFMAEYGNGHPKICYICEYDSPYKKGHKSHILGSNLISSISIGAALSLSNVVEKLGGTVIVLGCPGEYINGSKVAMVKQGIFEDIDAVLMAQPHTVTGEVCSSPATLPLEITYSCNKDSGCTKKSTYDAFDACIFTLNSINTLVKGFSNNCSIDMVSIKGDSMPCIPSNTVKTSFYIKASCLKIAEEIAEKIKRIAASSKDLMNIDSTVTLHEVPYENFISNKILTRIFAHNLKESGIIDDAKIIDIPYGLSFGNISHIIPCIRPYISIVEDENIQYGTEGFADATLSSYAEDRVLKTVQALAITGLDLIEKDSLLAEAKMELHKSLNKKC